MPTITMETISKLRKQGYHIDIYHTGIAVIRQYIGDVHYRIVK